MVRRARLNGLVGGLCAALAGPVGALDLPLPQGAERQFQEGAAAGRYALPLGAHDGAGVPNVALEGGITREAWRIKTDSLTNLQVLVPLRAALEAAGYEVVFDCASAACGGFDFRFGIEVLAPPAMHVDLSDYLFLSARGPDGAVSVLVSGTRVARFVQIIRVGNEGVTFPPTSTGGAALAPAPSPSAPLEADGLGAVLERAGHVVLDDLSFETGSATLSAGPYATLAALGRYLRAAPGRRIALVGHTDAVGGLEGNIALSQRRAEAVLERLAGAHDVARTQMEAGGMGYLAPRTSNLTPEGRALNRRVEAVLTSTE